MNAPHCERHRDFLGICDACCHAKRSHWRKPSLAEYLDADPVAAKSAADPIEEFDKRFRAHADITQKRHRGNGFSNAANPVDSAKSKDMAAIYQAFVERGPAGDISENVYLALGYPPQTGSARCSDLKRQGKLVPLKDKYGKAMRGETRTRNAAAILVADIFAPPAVLLP